MLCDEEQVRFSHALSEGNLPHACIVEALNKSAAERFVDYCIRASQCEGTRPPCGGCRACRKLASGDCPDVMILGTDGKPAGVDAVRKLIRTAAQPPNESRYSIFVLYNAEKLRREAQNALLKVLEEPRSATIIFLVTQKKESLLPTVRSRCRAITLTDPPPPKTKQEAEISSKALAALELLLTGSRRYDFFAFMTAKTTREKLSAFYGELETAFVTILRAECGEDVPAEYIRFTAMYGRRSLCRMAEISAAARLAAEGNANMNILQTATAVRLWEMKL